ncbi:MAG TPA: cobalt ECF transporter T component CbiQ [Polyangiaceae bacterium]|jgi:cobalt/nickel transport system permease protein|nr:cobalt ECF transporter T component CbiQ [Polyangiaceae bacterium]
MSGAHLLRSYSHLDSALHRAPASAKLAAALALVVAVALVPVERALWVLAPLAIVVGLAAAARIPLAAFASRVALAQPFVLGMAVLALFQGRGLGVFVAIALKSTTCVAAVQLLAHTTPFEAVLATLRRARVPEALVVTLGLLYRYLFVLVDEARRMRRARAARTWRGGRGGKWRALSSVIAVSFVRSAARAERIHAAMRARGGP